MSGARILVIDDDPGILRSLRRSLEGYGYAVRARDLGWPGVRDAAAFRPDVVLLDLILPDSDGMEVCAAIREVSDAPIIILSAIGEDERKVRALDAGADDYVTKPFSMAELQARIRVALRRAARQASSPVLSVGSISMDLVSHEVTVLGERVHLTPKEFDLLRLLMQEPGRLLTARHLLTAIWGPAYVSDTHILRTFIHQLRTKLGEADHEAAALLVNDPGVGYRLELSASRPARTRTES